VILCNKTVDLFEQKMKQEDKWGQNEYDAVFSTYGPLSSLFCGMYYKKTHPNTKWICDFRDPVLVKYVTWCFKPLYRYFEVSACKKADYIVSVSNGYLERICRGKYSDKAFMIPNGYDEEDREESAGAEPLSDKLNITYVGALYGGDRDMSPLFKAIGELIAEKSIEQDKICVNYAGKECSIFKEQASKHGMQDIVVDFGSLSRKECLKFQFSSDLLLLCTWNEKAEYGVFPGKFLEYMLIGKPIISITNGDVAGSEVTNVVREGDFGIAYETAADETDFPMLKEYIKKVYDEWVQNKKVDFSPKQEVLDRYNYKTIIKRIEDLING
jgi:hypothetical protein